MADVALEIEQVKQEFVDSDGNPDDIETLETELEFWLEVEGCDFCQDYAGRTLCCAHYGRYVGR